MNLKFHIIASAIFLLLIFGALVLFSTTQSKPVAPPPITKDRFIQIKSATWGENCNPFIKSLQEKARKKPKNESVPELVRRDNALRVVSSLCNGLETCQFNVNEETLRFDPAPTCAKNMEVEYRCFLTDMAHKADAEYDYGISIDCREAAE